MNIFGRYTSTTVEELPPGSVFACSSYASLQPMFFIGIKAVFKKDTNGAIVLEGLCSQRADATQENVDLYFTPSNGLEDHQALDITPVVSLLPDINSIVNRRSFKKEVPQGAQQSSDPS